MKKIEATKPLGTPPDNEIWYRTDNNRKIAFKLNNFDGVNINENIKVGDYWVVRLFGKCTRVVKTNTNFSHLTEISFPNCAKLESDLFDFLPNLQRVLIQNDEFESIPSGDGVVRTIYGVKGGKREPDDKYFMWCRPSVLTNGSLKYVTYITNRQFEGSDATSLVLPKQVYDVRSDAFHNCKDLEMVNLVGCKYIGIEAFSDCLNLRNVDLSNEIESILWMSFGRCSFSSIRIPGSIRYIDVGAFYGNENLHTVIFDRLKKGEIRRDFSGNMFDGCPNLKTVIVDNAEDADIIFKKFPEDKITFDIMISFNIDENGVIVKDK